MVRIDTTIELRLRLSSPRWVIRGEVLPAENGACAGASAFVSLAPPVRLWWNWQTRYFEVVVGKPVQVQVLLRAPKILRFPSEKPLKSMVPDRPHNSRTDRPASGAADDASDANSPVHG